MKKQSKRKKSSKQDLSLFIPITNLTGIWKGDFKKLPPNKVFTLEITYPLTVPAKIPIKTGKSGLSLMQLLNKIGEAYEKIYEEEDSSGDVSGRYGIWGHDIGDLSLEGITIDMKKKIIELAVGS